MFHDQLFATTYLHFSRNCHKKQQNIYQTNDEPGRTTIELRTTTNIEMANVLENDEGAQRPNHPSVQIRICSHWLSPSLLIPLADSERARERERELLRKSCILWTAEGTGEIGKGRIRPVCRLHLVNWLRGFVVWCGACGKGVTIESAAKLKQFTHYVSGSNNNNNNNTKITDINIYIYPPNF